MTERANGPAAAGMMIEDLNDALGRYVWLGRHLAGVADVWRAGESDGEVAVYYHGLARRCEEHAAAWEALLADSPALAAAERVRAPSAGWESLVDDTSTGASPLVVLVHVVLPRLVRSLEVFGRGLGPVAEAAEARLCAIVSDDLRGLSERGRALTEQKVPAPTLRRLVATLSRRQEGLGC